MVKPEFIRDIWEAENKEDGTRVELMNLGIEGKDDIWITVGVFDKHDNRIEGLTVELFREDLKRLRDVLNKVLGDDGTAGGLNETRTTPPSGESSSAA